MSSKIPESGSASSESVGLSDVIRMILRGAPFAIVAAIVAGVLAIALTRTMPPVYQASVAILAARPSSGFGSLDIITPPMVDPRVYQRVLADGPVIHDALLRLDGKDRSDMQMVAFKRNVDVSIENQEISAVIKIDVRDSNPQLAASYANAIAEGLIEWDRNRARLLVDNSIRALERSIAEIDAEITNIVNSGDGGDSQRQQALAATLREQRVRELEAAKARGASAVMVGVLEALNQATPPVEAIGPRLVFNTFVAVLLAVLLAYGVQIAYWSGLNAIGSSERLTKLTGLPVLAVFPRRSGSRKQVSGDAVGYLRTNLMRTTKAENPLVVGITTPTDFTDKADLAVALAESSALSGYRTLVVDADLRHVGPGLGLALDRFSSPGLDAYLSNPQLPLKPFAFRVERQALFEAIPSGNIPRQPNELLEFGFESFVTQLVGKFDVVIVDLPPVLSHADALVAAPSCSGIILCTDLQRRAESVTRSIRSLEGAGSSIIGAVVTGAPTKGRGTRRTKRPFERIRSSSSGDRIEKDMRAATPTAVAKVKQRGP